MARGLMTPVPSSSVVIDLTTPPTSPTARSQPSTASIPSVRLLCKSIAEKNNGRAQRPLIGSENKSVKRSAAPRKRKAEIQPTHHPRGEGITPDEDYSSLPDECVIVPAPPSRKTATGRGTDPLANRTSTPGSTQTDDDEVSFMGRTGNLALFDFPHAREHCVAHPWAPGAAAGLHCSNCWCYVCDAKVKDCPLWSEHCEATHKEPKWKLRRDQWKKRPSSSAAPLVQLPQSVGPPTTSPVLPATTAQELPRAPVDVFSDQRRITTDALRCNTDSWTAERVMHEVAQVFPLEEPEPEGLRVSLRPYQKQSLAFMLQIERAPEDQLLLGEHANQQRPMRGGWLSDETGMGKTCVCAALMLAQRTAASSSALDLAELHKRTDDVSNKTLVLKINDERYEGVGSRSSFYEPSKNIHLTELYEITCPGGERRIWCSRKKHPPVCKLNPEWEAWKRLPTVHLSATVVVTSNSLLGQWQDELRKFAPKLRVAIYHGPKKDDIFAQLANIDVVLTTPAINLFGVAGKYMSFIRLIIDESHATNKGKLGFLLIAARCNFVWGVTATPITSSIEDLGVVAQLLGQKQRLQRACVSGGFSATLVSVLRRLMIRHTKSQRLGGAAALALPDAGAETVWLEMDDAERAAYNAVDPCVQPLQNVSSMPLFKVEWHLQPRRRACSGIKLVEPCVNGDFKVLDGAKTAALLSDLNALRRNDAAVHAVVFTHHTDSYHHLRTRIAAAGFLVCGFSGADPANKRHATIRDFQASIDAVQRGVAPAAAAPAKVFIATVEVGSMGLTLTAATRVYLMEPCLDPSMEVQAAGRIHRLGQTKHVLVKRFCYKNSIDASVIKLHKKMQRGKVVIANGNFPKAAIDLLLKDRSGG